MAIRRAVLVVAVMAAGAFAFIGAGGTVGPASGQTCSAAYPDFCIPPPPPDLNCDSPAIAGRVNFTALAPDPHDLDGNDNDGLACEDPDRPRFPTTTTAQPGPGPTTTTAPPGPSATTTTTLPETRNIVTPAPNLPTGLLDRTG